MQFNDSEKEVIFLKAIKEMIDEMVNLEIFVLFRNDPQSELRFNSMTHQSFFNIILLDFLSCSDKKILGVQWSYLGALQSICDSPNFNKNNSICSLIQSTKEFVDWLEKEVIVENIWFPSIDLETNLSIKRVEFIKICGNISKHNFTRLSGVMRELVAIFKRNKISLKDEDALLVLDGFYDRFHSSLKYQSSTIAEFLNNIRWDIYEYLRPEFQQSIVYENNEHLRKYRYTYPNEVNNSFAKVCYWNLMNEVRSEPYMNKFQVTRFLKMRY